MPCLTVTSQKHSLETVKVHPFKCLENSNEAQAQCAFSNLPEVRPSIGEVSDIKKKFFYTIWERKLYSVNYVRFSIFCN